MLELRPVCEHCSRALPPETAEVWICSFECTFCGDCVERVLKNVCPNCGGSFMPRPVRPSKDRKGENYLGRYPASTKLKHRPVDPAAQALLVAAVGKIPPEKR